MKALERINLIEKVAGELQSRMTFADIDTYFKAYKIDLFVNKSEVGSKRVYVKELLSQVSEKTLLDIAEELELKPVSNVLISPEASFWAPSHFKLFLSHISSFKKTTKALQNALKPYGISGFVAHVDIEPTKQWQSEIEAGLSTMDALAALLMPGFKESNWTDQEVGFAVGKGVLIIGIIKGLDPYGFISKYQGLNVEGKSVADVADSIFKILTSSPKTKDRMLSCLVETILKSISVQEATQKLTYLDSITDLPAQYLERLRDEAPASKVFSKGLAATKLNQLLVKRNIKVNALVTQWDDFDDDILF